MHRRANRQVRLKSRPSGIPEAEHFEIVQAPVPDLSDGQVLVRTSTCRWIPPCAVGSARSPITPSLWRLVRSCARVQSGVSKSREVPTSTQVTACSACSVVGLRCGGCRRDRAQGRRLGFADLHVAWRPRPQWPDCELGLARGRSARAGETAVDRLRRERSGHASARSPRSTGAVPSALPVDPTRCVCVARTYPYAAVDYKADDLEAAFDAACPEGVDVDLAIRPA